MTKPTARELLEAFCRDTECDCVESQMAARVEKVLELPVSSEDTVSVLTEYFRGRRDMLMWVLHLLNGEHL